MGGEIGSMPRQDEARETLPFFISSLSAHSFRGKCRKASVEVEHGILLLSVIGLSPEQAKIKIRQGYWDSQNQRLWKFPEVVMIIVIRDGTRRAKISNSFFVWNTE